MAVVVFLMAHGAASAEVVVNEGNPVPSNGNLVVVWPDGIPDDVSLVSGESRTALLERMRYRRTARGTCVVYRPATDLVPGNEYIFEVSGRQVGSFTVLDRDIVPPIVSSFDYQEVGRGPARLDIRLDSRDSLLFLEIRAVNRAQDDSFIQLVALSSRAPCGSLEDVDESFARGTFTVTAVDSAGNRAKLLRAFRLSKEGVAKTKICATGLPTNASSDIDSL